jgi:hypothetical protein
MRGKRSPGLFVAGICLFIWAGAGTALGQMPIQKSVETIDVQTLAAANIVVGTVTGITHRGPDTSITIKPEQTLFGDPGESVRRELKQGRGLSDEDAVREMVSRKSRVLVIGSIFTPLDDGKLVVPTARGDLLRDSQATIDYVIEVLRTYPADRPVATFKQPIPKGWPDLVSPSFVTYSGALGLTVPVGPHLKRWALDAFRSGTDVDIAARALRLFRSDETIAELRPFLNTPVFAVSTPPEMNLGIEVRGFPVRRAAYDILKGWGVMVDEPELRQEVSKLGEVTRIVWSIDRPPDAAELARLLEARNLRTLEFPRPSHITDAQMSAVGRLTRLTSLKIRGPITDNGLRQILDLAQLEQLDLCLTRITEHGLAELRALPNLKRLMLTGTPLSDDGLRLLPTFPKLEYVNVMLTRITDEGAAEAQRSRPGLKIDRALNVDLGLNITINETLATANSNNVRRLTEQFRGDPNGRDFSGTPVIIYAAIQKDADVLQVLLNNGARVNVTDPAGTTPLDWAARYGRARAVKLLLDRGADTRIADNEGNTALHFAARQENPEPVRMLLAAGADPSAPNKSGQTALDVARDLGHKAVEEALTKPR